MSARRERVDTQALAVATMPLIPSGLQRSVRVDELAAQLEALLYGGRGLAIAYASNLISSDEASDAIAARLETWLVDRSADNLSHGEWQSDDFAAAIRGALERGIDR